MPIFRYKVKDQSGNESQGEISGKDERAVRVQLREQGYYILEMKAVRQRSTAWDPFRFIVRWLINPIFAGATAADLAVFYRQLAIMTRSGMSLIESLNSFREQSGSSRLKKIALESMAHLQEGGTLSEAFARYPWMFPELHISLIRAGEHSGTIDRMLQRIAEYLEHEVAVRQKLRLATLYPKILVIAVIFIPNIKLLVIPPIGDTGGHAYMRATFGVLLPILAGILALWVAFRLIYQIQPVKYGIDMVKLAIPKFGKMSRMLAMSKFYRVFSAMYSAGVPISQGLTHAGKACGNWYLNRRIVAAIPKIERGASLSEALGSESALPKTALDMMRTGERSGNIDEMLTKVAEYTEDEAEVSIVQTTLIIGFILLIAIALYIGSVVVDFWQGYGQSIQKL
jgi:type II secretory pathway component PulF